MRAAAPAAVLAFLLVLVAGASPAAADHRLGLGIHYFQTLDDLVSELDLDESGASWIISYQWAPEGLFRVEFDLEIFPDGFAGSTKTSVSPQAFLLVGHGFYGGIGIGITFSDGLSDNTSDPFFAGRIGYDLLVAPRIYLDFNLNYQVESFNDLDRLDSDVLTLGVIARYSF